jgi:uncharacterized membrane protein
MQIIIFLHVLSAIVWVGGMIAIRVAVHPTMQSIEEPKIKLGKTLIIMGKLFHLVLPFIVLLLITAIMMVLQFHFEGKFASLAYTKEIIWSVMTLNFSIMYLKRYRAEKLFNLGKLAEAKQQVSNIPNLLLPINILLGVVALYLGVVLRGV